MFNFNDYVREYLMEFFEANLDEEEYSESDVIDKFIEEYKEHDSYRFAEDKIVKKEFVLLVLFSDALKYLVYLHKVGLVNDDTAIVYTNLININSKEQLFEVMENEEDLFGKVIEYAHKYCEVDCLTKKIICKSLSSIENSWITKVFNATIYDMFEVSQKITLENLIQELKNNKQYQIKKYGVGLDDSNVERITGIVRSLGLYDVINQYELVLEIARVDYSVCKYLSDRLENCEYAIDRMDFYENYDITDIINNLVNNQVALKSAIWMVYSLYVDKDYEDIKLPCNLVEKVLTKKMEKKLTFTSHSFDDEENK